MPQTIARSQLAGRSLPALGAFVAIRVLGVVVLWAWALVTHGVRKDPHTLLSLRWDSLWYSRIAANGYGYEVHTHTGDLHSDLAFFPLMPMLERLGHVVTGGTVGDVGLGVSITASILAAAGIFAVVERLTQTLELPRSTPMLTVVLWAALPIGVVQWMAYSESLFTALAAWALYGVLTRRWVLAGVLASAAGLTRPVGLGVVLAVGVGAAMALRVKTSHEPAARFERVRMLLGVAIAPLGMAGYVVWVGRRTGRGLAGYVDIQAGWRNGFDGGVTFARFIIDKFSTLAGAAAGVGLLLGVALIFWGVWACLRLRMPWPVLTYVLVLVALALGAKGYFGSKPRFFLPVFPLLVPLAVWLAALFERRRVGASIGLAMFATASAFFGAFWLGGSGPP